MRKDLQMKNYAIEQSKEEINFAYSRLIDKLGSHVKLLSEESMPITSIMAMIRGLRRLKLDYLQQIDIKRTKLSENELLLADSVHKTFGVDVVPALGIGLFGTQQLKKVLISHEYEQLAKKGLKYKDIKQKLSAKYGWSVSSIEKLVYGK